MQKDECEELLMERARQIIKVLREEGRPVPLKELADKTGLRVGQVEAAVKFERRWFLDNPEDCKRSYIVSGRKGYRLPQKDDDYVGFYKTLYSSSISCLVTISAVGKYLEHRGYDVAQFRKDALGSGDDFDDEIGVWQHDCD